VDQGEKPGSEVVANEEHVKILKQGVDVWNAWRGADTPAPDLAVANLSHADLRFTDLSHANLIAANLSGADLSHANLGHANLSRADLSAANLSGAFLIEANLSGAFLGQAILFNADLGGADLTRAQLYETVFANVDLAGVVGLDKCFHEGPSTIDYRTLQQSWPLPLSFLRGVGLPDMLIDYLPSLLKQAIQHYSCFISYSTQDQEFADRLYADLQNKGVRCWFDKHDLRIGDKTWDAIDKAIKSREKLLLILSKHSIKSDWVEDEVQKAFAEERDRKQLVLFPVRIDNEVMETPEPWARKLRDQRHIGDFRRWQDHEAYKQSFERVVRDLTKEQPTAPTPP
jgi:uncharacterized protein YjbI with pentapeptide repeats